MFLLILLPASLALVLLLVNYCCYVNLHQGLTRWFAKLVGEYTFYGFLFCLYPLAVASAISFRYATLGGAFVGLILGAVFVVIVIV